MENCTIEIKTSKPLVSIHFFHFFHHLKNDSSKKKEKDVFLMSKHRGFEGNRTKWNGMDGMSKMVCLALNKSLKIYKSLLNVDNDNIDSRKVDDMSTTIRCECVWLWLFRLLRTQSRHIQKATADWPDSSIFVEHIQLTSLNSILVRQQPTHTHTLRWKKEQRKQIN